MLIPYGLAIDKSGSDFTQWAAEFLQQESRGCGILILDNAAQSRDRDSR
jgi:hypothetical protein